MPLDPNLGAIALRPPPFSHYRDLEVFEGPILSEFRARDVPYLGKWCARDGDVHRVLMVRSDVRAIAEYLAGRLELRVLLTRPNEDVGFLVDFRGAEPLRVAVVVVSTLPPRYLPRQAVAHDAALRPSWDRTPQSLLVNGGWDAKALSRLEKLYRELFAFTCLTGMPERFPEHVLDYRLDGGFAYSTAYESLRKYVPTELAPATEAVSAASPGVLTISADSGSAERIVRAMHLSREERVRAAHDALHDWSRLKPDKLSSVPKPAPRDIVRLCNALRIPWRPLLPGGDRNLEAGDVNNGRTLSVLVAGKLIAAHYVRLRRLDDPTKNYGDFEFLGPLPRE